MTRSKKRNNKQKFNSNNLLISQYKSEIIEKVTENNVVIIIGQTGCGKSTQVPKYLHENGPKIGLNAKKLIVCLHPRSVAAMSLAERVSDEYGQSLGVIAGFRIRFYEEWQNTARILYMTAGFMLRLLTNPTTIKNYSVVIVDEAHERTVENDMVMAQMQLNMARDKSLRLIIMSATLNIDEIKTYYPDAAVVDIRHVQDQVKIIHSPIKGSDYVAHACDIVKEILKTSTTGHILVFMPSEDKVWRCKQLLSGSGAKVLPLYGAMDRKDKEAVFINYKQRKVVVATNIAETSITIDGVYYVVDAGFVKRVRYDQDARVERWVTERVSVAEADQRKGRAGRTGNGRGECYRLYDEFHYETKLRECLAPFFDELELRYNVAQLRVVSENLAAIVDQSTFAKVSEQIDVLLIERPPKKDAVSLRFIIPEIVSANFEGTLLRMTAMKFKIKSFPFIVAPSAERLATATAHLKTLSLFDDDGRITTLGCQVARLPLEPSYGKVAVLASESSCREDVFIVLAVLASASLLKRRSAQSRDLNDRFGHADGDLMMLHNVFEEWESYRFSEEWCHENGIVFTSIKYARLVVAQLCLLLPSPWKVRPRSYFPFDLRMKEMKIAFLCAFFENLAVNVDGTHFKTRDDKTGIVYQYSCVDKSELCVMPLSNHGSFSSKQVIMKHCTVYDRSLLPKIDLQWWCIKADIWRHTIEFVKRSGIR